MPPPSPKCGLYLWVTLATGTNLGAGREAGRQGGREEVGGTDGCLLSHAKETDTGAGYLRAILSR